MKVVSDEGMIFVKVVSNTGVVFFKVAFPRWSLMGGLCQGGL